MVRKDLKGDTDCQPEFLTAEDLKLHLGSYDKDKGNVGLARASAPFPWKSNMGIQLTAPDSQEKVILQKDVLGGILYWNTLMMS